ncbi:hydroxyphenylacetyl-CoA thioesterase PaaI [Roseobacter sp.]|uniref:hydroxyphenylacetyl-CoA thioesterase PaaI n=1 Tax=Roseobacter sp. TaxID=1907202 RepID=UPI002966B235|nr:hydroxyphenylacetyl-CoA thioesterase PaaI [Roseobacter sp.]MDW3180662.1 hydroxyphenylacetyl-CoA thioesterase PaaI [Roseobacter sp.]
MSEDVTAQARAEKCAALMMDKDAASRGLGMHLDRVAPGMATLSMQVTPEMLNGHGICHGGYIFTLADSAFAFACNTYNQLTVAQQNQITYLAPGKAGDRLTATALEVARIGRSGTYDVTVSDSAGTMIALFRGLSRTIKGQHFPENGDPA